MMNLVSSQLMTQLMTQVRTRVMTQVRTQVMIEVMTQVNTQDMNLVRTQEMIQYAVRWRAYKSKSLTSSNNHLCYFKIFIYWEFFFDNVSVMGCIVLQIPSHQYLLRA